MAASSVVLLQPQICSPSLTCGGERYNLRIARGIATAALNYPLSQAHRPITEPVQIKVEHGRGVKCQQLADDQPAHNGEPERPADFTAITEAQR
jgi:hypothetical protein